VVLLCGGLCVVSAVNSHGTDLRPGYTDLATLVGSEASSYKKLEKQVSSLQKQVTALTNAVPDQDVKKAQQRADEVKAPAGLTAVSGPGVTVTLSDAPRDLIEHTTHNANLLVVHQQDIQAVVNALWTGGATAVTVQGQRIISTTGIRCSGSTVTLQGVPYPQPYVIKAVGAEDELLNALEDSTYLQTYRDQAADPTIGIGWKVGVDGDVRAPAYRGLLDLNYARPLPGSA
jgi:uncharacterized protein YlxW (UPF0749 family)